MTDNAAVPSDEVLCHRCGYDLRAHPREGHCPECGEPIAESRRLAAIPKRPRWRESDPRWRRRMVAGAWVLVLLPLMQTLITFGWAVLVPVPTVFDFRGTVRTLDQTLAAAPEVYQPVAFCVGVVLLLSTERGRRPGRLDWTRRWGILCCYVTLLLSAASTLFIGALVLGGVSAVFLGMPLEYRPEVTGLLIALSTGYLLYGAHPMEAAAVVHVVSSSIAVLLACVPLFHALAGSGPKRVAAILLAPLAVFALLHVGQAVWYLVTPAGFGSSDFFRYSVYFWPRAIVDIDASWRLLISLTDAAIFIEAMKWCIMVAIAVWLSVAQFAASRPAKARE